jgi:hypothetical protein
MLRVTFSIPFITPNAVTSFQLTYRSASSSSFFKVWLSFPFLFAFSLCSFNPQGYWREQKENQEFCYSVNAKSLSYYSLGYSVEVSVSNNALSFHSVLDQSSIKNKEGLYTMDRIYLFIDRIVSTVCTLRLTKLGTVTHSTRYLPNTGHCSFKSVNFIRHSLESTCQIHSIPHFLEICSQGSRN